MTRGRGVRLAGSWACVLVCASILAGVGSEVRAAEKQGKGRVGLVFFGSRGCPSCAQVKELLHALSSRYPVEVKAFDTGKPEHNALLDRLEQIHAKNGFSVPLVLVGESILMGEREIAEKLEPMVRDLAASGGSSFPYLGPDRRLKPTRMEPTHPRCDSKSGRPPTIGEELDKLRGFLRRFY